MIGPRAWLSMGAVLVLAAGAAVMGATRGSGSGTSSTRAAEVEAYVQAITPAARQGGFVIQKGMKPAVSALSRGEETPVVMQAVAWVDQLNQVRKDFQAAEAPRGLQEAAAAFDQALAQYIDAAEHIGSAGMVSGDMRVRLLDQAVAAARQADETYDSASRRLQQARRQHGLQPSSVFPDPGPEESS
jgi:hypothetical protein